MYSLSLIVGRSGRAECVPAWLVPFWLCCWGQVCSCCGLPLGSLLVELQVLLGTVCPCFVGGAVYVPVGGASGAPWDCVSLFCWWGRECPCWWSLRCSLGLCVPVLLVGPRVSLLVEPQVLLGTVSLFCRWGRECPCWWSLRCSLGLCVPVLLVGPCVPLLVEPQVLLGTVGPCFLLVELQVLLGTVCPLFCCILIKLQVFVGDRVSLCVVGRGSRVSLLLELWCMKWFGVVAIFSKPELFRISFWCWGWTVSKRLSWRNICFVASSIYHLLQIAFIFSVLQWIRLLHLQLYAPKSS